MRGGFDLFGRQHEMMFAGYSRQRNHYDNALPDTPDND
jgi:outer membrane receptor for ferric coprogen and ferric-rhodotorulic acid